MVDEERHLVNGIRVQRPLAHHEVGHLRNVGAAADGRNARAGRCGAGLFGATSWCQNACSDRGMRRRSGRDSARRTGERAAVLEPPHPATFEQGLRPGSTRREPRRQVPPGPHSRGLHCEPAPTSPSTRRRPQPAMPPKPGLATVRASPSRSGRVPTIQARGRGSAVTTRHGEKVGAQRRL